MRLAWLRIRKVLAALKSASKRRALWHGVGASVEHSSALRQGRYRTVVDIGANKGQFALFARDRFPEANVHSFEPLPAAADIFSVLFRDDPRCQLYRVGIGPAPGTSELFVTSENDASSVLRPNDLQSKVFGTQVVETCKIPMSTLAQCIQPSSLAAPALLKVDVQGFELATLTGCEELLHFFDDILIEVSFIELYDDQPTASAVISWLYERGFVLRGIFNQETLGRWGPLQADLLLRRTELVRKNGGLL
jgi:FkbM family methyltransferase